jgi:hypothetical protein
VARCASKWPYGAQSLADPPVELGEAACVGERCRVRGGFDRVVERDVPFEAVLGVQVHSWVNAEAPERVADRPPQQKAAFSRLKTEMTKAGVLVRSLRLQPSAKGKRLVFTNNDLRVIDGPFMESRELIGGFAVMALSGMDEVIALCRPDDGASPSAHHPRPRLR